MPRCRPLSLRLGFPTKLARGGSVLPKHEGEAATSPATAELRRHVTSFGRRVCSELQTRALSHAIIALVPTLVLATLTGRQVWLQAALVTVSAIVAKETAHLALVGVLLHGAAIAVGFLILLISLAHPLLFVATACAMAAASILITARGSKLRPLGNFTFIPTLYLACEVGEAAGASGLPTAGLAYLPCVAVAVLPVAVLAGFDHARDRDLDTPTLRHLRSVLRRRVDHGPSAETLEALLAAVLAVASASTLVEFHHLEHGQWVIWSAASVVVGDFRSSRRKLYDRYLGALVGVPVGTVIGLLLPQSGLIRVLAGLGAVLTLLGFRRYVVGFATRCALIALILVDAAQSTLAAVERVQNVVMGGAIGIAFVVGVHATRRLYKRMA